MKLSSILLLILTVFFSCNQPQEKTELKTLHFPYAHPQKVKLSNLIDDYEYIKLEKNNECVIGGIAQLEITEDNIYLLDGFFTKSLFVFDRGGKYLFKIHEIGSGPGEYDFPTRFQLDQKNNIIYILDEIQKKLILYDLKDGRFLEEINHELRASSFILLENNQFALDLFNYQSDKSLQNGLYHNLLILNMDGQILSRFGPVKEFLLGHNFGATQCFTKKNDQILYIPPLVNRIYSFSLKNKIFETYCELNFGIEWPGEEFIGGYKNTTELMKKWKENKYPRYIKLIQANDRLNISFKAAGEYYYYFKDEKGNIIGTKEQFFIDDIFCGGLKVDGAVENKFFGALDSYELLEKAEEEDQYSQNPKLVSILENLQQNDNPVIMIYSLN